MYNTKLDIWCLVHDLTPLRIAIGAYKSVDSRIMGSGLPEHSTEDNDCGGPVAVCLSSPIPLYHLLALSIGSY